MFWTDSIHASTMLHLSKVRMIMSLINTHNCNSHDDQKTWFGVTFWLITMSRGISCGWTPAAGCRSGPRSRWHPLDSFNWSTMKERYKPLQNFAYIRFGKRVEAFDIMSTISHDRSTRSTRRRRAPSGPCTPPPWRVWMTWLGWVISTRQDCSGTFWSGTKKASYM